jgi:hypothetical protein
LDDFEVGQCEGMVRPECEEDTACELLDSITTICTKKDSELLASRKDAICSGYEQEVVAALQFPGMTTEEVAAVDAKLAESPTEVEFAFVEGISYGLPSVLPSSIKVATLASDGTTFTAVIEVRRPYGEANTMVSELDTIDKGAVVDGVTDALIALGLVLTPALELTDVIVQDAVVLVYPNRDRVEALPLPAKPTGLETTAVDDRAAETTTTTSTSGGSSMLMVGGVIFIIVLIAVAVGAYLAMQARSNAEVQVQPAEAETVGGGAWTEAAAEPAAAEVGTEG